MANSLIAVVGDVFGPAVAALTLGLYGEDRYQKEHGALRERITDRGRHHRDGDIARMVKG
jgi:hypothetical protein